MSWIFGVQPRRKLSLVRGSAGPANASDVLNAHPPELPKELAYRVRRPCGDRLPTPTARADDQQARLHRARQGSWPSAATTATSHKPTPRPVALTRPLGVPLLTTLADRLLLGRRYRASLETSAQKQSDQDSENILSHYSITWSARCRSDGGMISPRIGGLHNLPKLRGGDDGAG